MNKSADYLKISEEKDAFVKSIIDAESAKKIIVSGPGTGKTYLFKKILEEKRNCLTLSFVNSLIDDLSLELYGLSTVKTLHGFARSELSRIAGKGIEISPKISKVIKEDALFLQDMEYRFEKIFHELTDNKDAIEFYRKRRLYYRYYGYTDIIYALIKCYEKNPDRIPTYEQILVDEFQDFNKLEVSLIDILAKKSPILIVGDDDQALYDFKSASTEFIREKYGDSTPDFAPFDLPYCLRCTRIIVDSVNDFMKNATEKGHLKGRIDKPYKYFENEEKDIESDRYQYLNHSHIFVNRMPWFIEQMIASIAKNLKQKFTVLIISPYRIQAEGIVTGLKSKGLQNIEYDQRGDSEVLLIDGLLILLDDFTSNLGWRMVTRFLLEEELFKTLLKQTYDNPEKLLFDLVDSDLKKKIKKILATLRAIHSENVVSDEKIDNLVELIKFDCKSAIVNAIRKDLIQIEQKNSNPAIKNIPIKVTTIQSSKGLSADFVFITHFDDQYYFESKDKSTITDHEICNFLVALTRARKQVFLISSIKTIPEFLTWIPEKYINKIEI